MPTIDHPQPQESQDTAASRAATAPAWLVLTIACAGQFMVVLDVSVVNVALPSIRRGLHFDPAGLQWVVNAYALTFAGFLLLGGRLADLYGRKRVFLTGLALFAAASLGGGLASTAGMLVAARALQGVGAAVLAPATLTILTTVFTEPAARAKALGTWTAMGAAGGATGGLIGGLLTEYLSWRWILLINVPVGVVAIALAAVFLTERARDEEGPARLDVPGALLATVGLAALTYGIVQTQVRGWSAAGTLVPLAGGLVVLAAFVATEARLAPAPLMPLRLFRSRAVSAGDLVMLLLGAAFITMWYFLSLYLQNVKHYGALRTGFAFTPHTIMIVAGARSAPRLLPRFGARRMIIVGAVVGAAGFAWQSRITPHTAYLPGVFGPALLMCGGLGLMMTPVATTVTSGAGPRDAGVVSGLMNAARQVGGSLGLAVLATLAGRHTGSPADLATGYGEAFLSSAAILLAVIPVAAALPALRRPATSLEKQTA